MLLHLVAVFQIAASPPVPRPPVGAPVIYNGREGQTTARAPAINGRAEIDGRVDEPMWREAAMLTGFSLYAPVDQRPAPDSTEVLVWYSPTAIYFGIRAFEPHGS